MEWSLISRVNREDTTGAIHIIKICTTYFILELVEYALLCTVCMSEMNTVKGETCCLLVVLMVRIFVNDWQQYFWGHLVTGWLQWVKQQLFLLRWSSFFHRERPVTTGKQMLMRHLTFNSITPSLCPLLQCRITVSSMGKTGSLVEDRFSMRQKLSRLPCKLNMFFSVLVYFLGKN